MTFMTMPIDLAIISDLLPKQVSTGGGGRRREQHDIFVLMHNYEHACAAGSSLQLKALSAAHKLQAVCSCADPKNCLPLLLAFFYLPPPPLMPPQNLAAARAAVHVVVHEGVVSEP
jgi:hypothetical protein